MGYYVSRSRVQFLSKTGQTRVFGRSPHKAGFPGRPSRRLEQYEEETQAVDVAPRINVQPAHLRLLRPDELVQLGVNRRVGQPVP
jgi:hypothetical protein